MQVRERIGSTVLATGMLTGAFVAVTPAPAQAGNTFHYDHNWVTQRWTSTTFGFSAKTVHSLDQHSGYASLTAAACRFVPVPVFGFACILAIGFEAAHFANTVHAAARYNQCVTLTEPWYGFPFVIRRESC